MKQGIHPEYNEITVVCSCGNSFVTRSTAPQIKVEICSNCHPLFTGQQKLIDTAGRVDKFKKRLLAAEEKKKTPSRPSAQPKEELSEETLEAKTVALES